MADEWIQDKTTWGFCFEASMGNSCLIGNTFSSFKVVYHFPCYVCLLSLRSSKYSSNGGGARNIQNANLNIPSLISKANFTNI